MIGFLLKRLTVVIPTLIGVTIVAFALIRMIPGDQARNPFTKCKSLLSKIKSA